MNERLQTADDDCYVAKLFNNASQKVLVHHSVNIPAFGSFSRHELPHGRGRGGALSMKGHKGSV